EGHNDQNEFPLSPDEIDDATKIKASFVLFGLEYAGRRKSIEHLPQGPSIKWPNSDVAFLRSIVNDQPRPFRPGYARSQDAHERQRDPLDLPPAIGQRM